MILGISFLLMVSMVFGAVLTALGKWWGGMFGGWQVLAQVLNVLIGFVLTTGVFAMIYKLMPRVRVQWHDVWLGAVVTALLFTIGKFLIGLYIGRSGIASGFGAAGSLVIVLVWVYYSAQIFLIGAEFTWVYARTFGSMRGLEAPEQERPSPAEAVPSRSASESPAAKEAVAKVDTVTHGTPGGTPPGDPARRAPRRPWWLRLGAGMLAGFTISLLLPRWTGRR
jgi:membrane protein